MKITKLSDLGGIGIEGVDLSKPRAQGVDKELFDLYNQHGLVVFHGQNLTKQQLVDACAPFGGAMINVPAVVVDEEAPGITIISTRGPDGKTLPDDHEALVGDIEWHTDQGFLTHPNRGKYLYAVQVPEKGGMTGFIDGQQTYNDLSDAMKKRIENLHVIQSWNRAEDYIARNRDYRIQGHKAMAHDKFPEIVYPVVNRHPITGAKVLNVPPLWSMGFVELARRESDDLLEELKLHIKQPKYQYWHKYKVGDALIWDNWRFLHAASGTPGKYVRTIWSVVINGGPEMGTVLKKAS